MFICLSKELYSQKNGIIFVKWYRP